MNNDKIEFPRELISDQLIDGFTRTNAYLEAALFACYDEYLLSLWDRKLLNHKNYRKLIHKKVYDDLTEINDLYQVFPSMKPCFSSFTLSFEEWERKFINSPRYTDSVSVERVNREIKKTKKTYDQLGILLLPHGDDCLVVDVWPLQQTLQAKNIHHNTQLAKHLPWKDYAALLKQQGVSIKDPLYEEIEGLWEAVCLGLHLPNLDVPENNSIKKRKVLLSYLLPDGLINSFQQAATAKKQGLISRLPFNLKRPHTKSQESYLEFDKRHSLCYLDCLELCPLGTELSYYRITTEERLYDLESSLYHNRRLLLPKIFGKETLPKLQAYRQLEALLPDFGTHLFFKQLLQGSL